MRASKQGDSETVLNLMSDNVVFLVARRPPIRGKTTFAAAHGGMSGFQIDATSEIQEIKVPLACCLLYLLPRQIP